MAQLELRNVCRRWHKHTVLSDFSLKVDHGEFVVLVGPSGCGKSTLLRIIAGLDLPDEPALRFFSRSQILPGVSGEILIDGVNVSTRSPAERGVAMVFQNYALYPHMSVRENMAFGLRRAGLAGAEIDARIVDAASLLGLDELLERKPAQLSGGQKQRVAMGRAIVKRPGIFLFDEPLSNLDAQLRVRMRAEIAALHRRLGATVIYVTHDQVEAMTLGSRMVVMNAGRIEQEGQPLDVYSAPQTTFVAGFVGSPPLNLLKIADIAKSFGDVAVSSLGAPQGADQVGFRSEVADVLEGRNAPADSLVLRDARVELVEPLGGHAHVHLRLAHQDALSRSVILETRLVQSFARDSRVSLVVRREHLRWFDAAGQLVRPRDGVG